MKYYYEIYNPETEDYLYMACSIPVKPGHVPLQMDGVGYTQCREISQSEYEELTEGDAEE